MNVLSSDLYANFYITEENMTYTSRAGLQVSTGLPKGTVCNYGEKLLMFKLNSQSKYTFVLLKHCVDWL